jgi:branched-chain amino acid transport system permease protein
VVGPIAQERLAFLPIGAASGMLLVFIGSVAILFGVLEPRGMAHRWSLIKSFYRLWPFGY